MYPRSIAAAHNSVFFLGRQNGSKSLGVLTASPSSHKVTGENRSVRLGATDALLTIGQLGTRRERGGYGVRSMLSASRSATASVERFVLERGIVGMPEASAT